MWRFKSILKPTIWGGSRIASYKGVSATDAVAEDTDCSHIGESLELSAIPGATSIVADGKDAGLSLNDLIARDKEALLGSKPYQRFGNLFPLLVKILDAGEDLSVQVHPDDDMAHRLNIPYGKNELWYVLDTTPEARVCIGLTHEISPEQYYSLVDSGRFSEILKCNDVKPDEAYYIPAGVVHALGKGCMVFEIQQTCDTTYRIYDYERRDSHGRKRELHTDLAMEALRHEMPGQGHIPYPDLADKPVELLHSPQFCLNRLRLTSPATRDYTSTDSFKILVMARGAATVDDGSVRTAAPEGSVWLVAASSPGLDIVPAPEGCVILEAYLDLRD